MTRSGDDGEVCSFCGRSRFETNTIVAGPGVAICVDCAQIAIDCSYEQYAKPLPEGYKSITVFPLLEADSQEGDARFDNVRALLHETAASLDSELLNWRLFCGCGNLPDYLAASLRVAEIVDSHEFHEKFKTAFAIQFREQTAGQND